jgi:hypothetical protein
LLQKFLFLFVGIVVELIVELHSVLCVVVEFPIEELLKDCEAKETFISFLPCSCSPPLKIFVAQD